MYKKLRIQKQGNEFILTENNVEIDRCKDARVGVHYDIAAGEYYVTLNGWTGTTGWQTTLKKEFL